MQFSRSILLMMAGLLVGSCAVVEPINMKEAQLHYQAALSFEAQGDLDSAREQYWRAFVAARSGDAKPETLSMLAYEFGRTTGYTCHLDESERFLLEALKMEESLPVRNGRNIGIRLFELARLMYDQERYKEAVGFYSRALREVEQNDSVKSDPIAFADIYEEYADALVKIGDDHAAQEALGRASSLREANPGRAAKFRPVRYRCDKPLALQAFPSRTGRLVSGPV